MDFEIKDEKENIKEYNPFSLFLEENYINE